MLTTKSGEPFGHPRVPALHFVTRVDSKVSLTQRLTDYHIEANIC
jgi:hypothetical protein